MKRFFLFLISLFFFLSLHFCGKKGPIFAPHIKTPQGIEEFDFIQRGDKIILEWTNPETYEDGDPLPEIDEIEVWLYERERESVTEGESIGIEEFSREAKIISLIKPQVFPWYRIRRNKGEDSHEFCYFYELTHEDLISKILIFGLRIKYRKRREAAFSALHEVKPEILPLPPRRIKATVHKDRIEIRWGTPERNINQTWPPLVRGYNIYRVEEDGSVNHMNTRSLITDEVFEDSDFLFGKKYCYFIRASKNLSAPFSESEDSEEIEIVPKDVFPPAVPTDLMSVAGENFITVSWNEDREEDLAGYRVWRKVEDEIEYILMTPEPIRENTYNDTTVEKNKRYYYAITAQDINGNESQKSEAISEIIRDEIL